MISPNQVRKRNSTMMEDGYFRVEKINPGILVGEQCSLRGGVTYVRNYHETDLDGEKLTKKYDAEVVVQNVKERKEGDRTRASCRYKLRSLCADTPVGLICSLENSDKLKEIISEIREKISQFNKDAATCRIVSRYAFYYVKEDNAGAIAAISDQLVSIADKVQEAIKDNEVRIINAAPRRLLKGYQRDEIMLLPEKEKDVIVASARVDKIRNAVSEAKCLDQLLVSDAKDKVDQLISQSKNLAKKIRRDVVKHGQALNDVLEETDTSGVNNIRSIFLSAMMIADEENEQELVSIKGF